MDNSRPPPDPDRSHIHGSSATAPRSRCDQALHSSQTVPVQAVAEIRQMPAAKSPRQDSIQATPTISSIAITKAADRFKKKDQSTQKL